MIFVPTLAVRPTIWSSAEVSPTRQAENKVYYHTMYHHAVVHHVCTRVYSIAPPAPGRWWGQKVKKVEKEETGIRHS